MEKESKLAMTNLNWLFLSIAAFFLNLSTDHIETLLNNNCEEVATGMWELQSNVPTLENLSSVYFLNVNDGWAVGGGGTILNTTDGGATWTSQTSGTGAFLHSVSFLDNQIGYAVGFPNSNGVENLLHTTNGGVTWSNSSPSAFSNYYAVDIIDFGDGAIVGSNNFPSEGVTVQILATTFFNYQTPVPMGVNTELRGVDFVDTGGNSATGYAVGSGGVIVKTISGGTIWSSVPSPTTSLLLGVSFVDENIGWAVGSGGTIIHTVDGGNSWVSQTSGTPFALNDVHFVDANNGWAVGNGGVLLNTEDGGISWNFENLGITENLKGVYFTDIDNGWVVGHDGTVLKYSNNILPVEYLFFDGQAKDEKVILNWASVSEVNNEGYEVQRKSKDQDWVTLGFVSGQGNSYSTQEYDFTDHLASSGLHYYRLRQIDYDGSADYSKMISIYLEKSTQEMQIYPNPTTDGLIHLVFSDIIRDQSAHVSVYNSNGILVQSSFINSLQEVKIDLQNLPSGIYSLTVNSSNRTWNKKVVSKSYE